MPSEISPGQWAETVGDIIGDKPAGPAPRVLPARHDDQPPFPEPGIYFGMSDDVYHAINAASATGMKNLSVSSMDHWAESTMNRDREDGDTKEKARGRAYHVRICEGPEAFAERYAVELDRADYPEALVTVADIRAALAEAGEPTNAPNKDILISRLMRCDPDAQVWDVMVQRHAEANDGKTFISPREHRRVEIAARMIEADPDLSKAFKGGYPEVSIFWFDEATGCPCKARIDYLKPMAIVDLKSFGNPIGRKVDRAIDFTIANHKHFIGAVWYSEAVEAAKRMIVRLGTESIFPMAGGDGEIVEFCERLAKQDGPPVCLWVYQQTGNAPVTRGRIQPRGTVWTITAGHLQMMKRRYVEMTKAYGTDPWLDLAPITETTDEDVPLSATDL